MARMGIFIERNEHGDLVAGVLFPDSMPAEGLTALALALEAAISRGCGCAQSCTRSCTQTDPAAPQTQKAPAPCA